MAGGGAHGEVAGTGHIIITGVGSTIELFPVFILMWTQGGEDPTETICGVDTDGTMKGSLTNNFSGTGRTGKRHDIGNSKNPGAFKTIGHDRSNKYRNNDGKGKINIKIGPRFSVIRNRYKSSRNKAHSINLNRSALNLVDNSNMIRNHSINRINKEKKEGMMKIESE